MNYSQRKYLERLMADAPRDDFDYLGLRSPASLLGFSVVESQDVPRYTLPAEVMPGVPWRAGLREEINRWSREFLGSTNLLPRGTVYMMGSTAIMNQRDAVMLVNCAT